MRKYLKSGLSTLLVNVSLLATSCSSTNNAVQSFSGGIDSIKVEVSRPIASHALLLDQGRKATLSRNGKTERTLTVQETGKLKSLAEKLFVKKSDPIILSEEKAYGRTSQPIFSVTLYNKGKGVSTRYDMGDEDNGMTQATTKRIRYSEAFREFMFSVLHLTR